MEKREFFKSRLGFILVSAGCAIGIGNVWKFPYMTGAYGGAVFVLFYLLFLVLMGIPVMTMELAVGRGSGQSIVKGYKALEKPKAKWHWHGWLCIIGCYLLMMYYTTVSGWIVNYFFKFAFGAFNGIGADGVGAVFGSMLASPWQMVGFMVLTTLAGFGVLIFGVQKGLERVTKVMMVGLIILIVILAGHSLFLSGAKDGVKFYLLPDFGKAVENGLGKVITGAMNQAFFTLSLGIASMEIFGSYMTKDHTLLGEATRITILDTFVALMAGLIIFPTCVTFGVEADAGPSLIFVTLPHVFMNMKGGQIWGTLFFLFMTFASFSTVVAVFENLVAAAMDNWGWSRKKSVGLNAIFMTIMGLPCALGYNLLSNVHLIGARDILDSEDFIVSNLLLPIGALVFLLFCVTKWGWGFDKYQLEANTGEGKKIPHWFKYYFQFVLPFLILIILIQGLIG